MPTIIDSFLVEFGIDPKGTVKGGKTVEESFRKSTETARKSSKDMEDYGKKASEFFGSLKTEAVGLFLAFAGASSIKSFVEDLIGGDAATGRLAKNIGEATENVSAYQMAVKSLGGSAADADASLRLMAKAREDLVLTGITGHGAELNRLGVTREDLTNGPVAALEKIAAAGERMKRVDFYALLGRLGIPEGAMESLVHGRKNFDDLIAAKRRDGAATDEDARKAQEFQSALANLESKIIGDVRPAVYGLVTSATELATGFETGKVKAHDFTGILVALGVAAGVVGAPFVALAAAIAAVALNIDRLKASWASMTSWYDAASKGTDSIFDRARKAMGLKSGAEAEAAGTDIFGNPTSLLGGAGSPTPTAVPANMGKGDGGDATKGSTLQGRKNFVFSYWKSKGFDDQQAAGMTAANLAENDTLMPHRVNPISAGKSHAMGLGQWLGARQRLYSRLNGGKSINDATPKEQLDFMFYEMQHGAGGKEIRGSKSAQEAAYAMISKFYVPGKGEQGDRDRADRALGIKGGTTIHVAKMDVHTKATDGQQLADTLPPAIIDRSLANAAQRGLN